MKNPVLVNVEVTTQEGFEGFDIEGFLLHIQSFSSNIIVESSFGQTLFLDELLNESPHE